MFPCLYSWYHFQKDKEFSRVFCYWGKNERDCGKENKEKECRCVVFSKRNFQGFDGSKAKQVGYESNQLIYCKSINIKYSK